MMVVMVVVVEELVISMLVDQTELLMCAEQSKSNSCEKLRISLLKT